MSTDLELLELAAKAAGYQIEWVRNSGCHYRCEEEIGREQWCPLDDDGDALRLAVKLKIEVAPETFSKNRVDARAPCGKWLWEMYPNHSDDGQKAARCVIVRVAAEIGRAMP